MDNVSRAINAIRRAAGNQLVKCPVCNQPPTRPYRRTIDGATVEGCVDATHSEHPDAWHDRPVGFKLRAEELARLTR